MIENMQIHFSLLLAKQKKNITFNDVAYKNEHSHNMERRAKACDPEYTVSIGKEKRPIASNKLMLYFRFFFRRWFRNWRQSFCNCCCCRCRCFSFPFTQTISFHVYYQPFDIIDFESDSFRIVRWAMAFWSRFCLRWRQRHTASLQPWLDDIRVARSAGSLVRRG